MSSDPGRERTAGSLGPHVAIGRRHMTTGKVIALEFALASLAAISLSPDASDFVDLAPWTSATSTYVLGSEAELGGSKDRLDLERLTQQRADISRGSFQGAEDKKIHYRIYKNRTETRGGIVIVSGRTEGLALYQETIHD